MRNENEPDQRWSLRSVRNLLFLHRPACSRPLESEFDRVASGNHRGTGIFRRSISRRLSSEFKEELDGLPGVAQPQASRRAAKRIGNYLADLWDRRLFIYVGARGEASTSHSRDRLGLLWLIIRPLLDAVFYYVIFALLLKVDRGMDNFIAWLLVGLFMFQFTSAFNDPPVCHIDPQFKVHDPCVCVPTSVVGDSRTSRESCY